MDIEANKNSAQVTEILHQEEARRVVLAAGRATTAQAWIGFAALMVTLLGIAAAGLVAYTQLSDKATATAHDTEEMKGEVRSLNATVNLMAGRMGVQPQKATEMGVAWQLPTTMPLDSNLPLNGLPTEKEGIWTGESLLSRYSVSPPPLCFTGNTSTGEPCFSR